MAERELLVSVPDEQVHVCMGGDTYSIMVKGSDTAERFAVIDMYVPPGGGPLPHSHECEETFYVTEGEVTVFFKETRAVAKAGTAVNIPGWAPHMFRNLGKVPARMICVVSPAGLERQFLEIGVRVATRTSPPPPVSEEQKAEFMKNIPTIVAKYNGKVFPPDTFNHLMSAEEVKFLREMAE